MKQFIFLAALAFSGTSVMAQVHEGTIIYERKVNMHRRIQNEEMKARIPEYRTSKYQLLFADSVSVYKAVPEDEMPEAGGEGGGPRVVMSIGGPGENGELYKNFAEARAIQSTDLGAKTYLIMDSIRSRNWKLTTETKTILGYTCRKAVTTETVMQGGGFRMVVSNGNTTQTDTANKPKPVTIQVEAWYAEGINTPAGPDSYGMLPGVVLEVNIDNGATVFTALEIKKEVPQKELKEPKKGKKITRQEYMDMLREMLGGANGPGGQRTFRF